MEGSSSRESVFRSGKNFFSQFDENSAKLVLTRQPVPSEGPPRMARYLPLII